jgi:hypothetical protein
LIDERQAAGAIDRELLLADYVHELRQADRRKHKGEPLTGVPDILFHS